MFTVMNETVTVTVSALSPSVMKIMEAHERRKRYMRLKMRERRRLGKVDDTRL